MRTAATSSTACATEILFSASCSVASGIVPRAMAAESHGVPAPMSEPLSSSASRSGLVSSSCEMNLTWWRVGVGVGVGLGGKVR